MNDLGFELVVGCQAIFFLVRGVFQLVRGLVRVVARRMKGAHDSGPGAAPGAGPHASRSRRRR